MKIVLFIYLTVFASERPVIPEPGIDLKATNGKDFELFLSERRLNVDCLESLSVSEKNYKEALSKLNTALNEKIDFQIIDSLESEFNEKKKEYLKFIKECGHCVSREIENRVIITPLSSENWYISDGSCLDKNTDEAMMRAYLVRKDSLLRVSKYAVTTGGFSNILYFTLVNNDSGEKITNVEEITFSPYYAYIGVKGPFLFNIYTAATYYFKAEWKEWEKDNIKHFIVRFNTTKKPKYFIEPEIFQPFLSGKKMPVRHMELNLVQGSWYLNSKGYMRYYTAADFGFTFKVNEALGKFMKNIAHMTLLETLVQMSERGNSENY